MISILVIYDNLRSQNATTITILPTIDYGIKRNANPYTVKNVLPANDTAKNDPYLIKSSENLPLTLQFGSTMCFGDCPVYSILILENGNAYFDGEENTLDDGVHKIKLSPDQMIQLKEKVLGSKVFEMNIQSSLIFDVSYNYLAIGWNEKGKSMRYIRGQDLPRALYDLQCFIHTIVESEKWIGVRDWSCTRLDNETKEN